MSHQEKIKPKKEEVRFLCDRWAVGVSISACASDFLHTCGRSVVLTCFLLPSILFGSLFNHAVNLCGAAQITHGGRERVILCGRLRGIRGKDGARENGEVQIKMRNGGERGGHLHRSNRLISVCLCFSSPLYIVIECASLSINLLTNRILIAAE